MPATIKSRSTLLSSPLCPPRRTCTLAARPPPPLAPDPTPAAAEIFRVPPPFRGRTASSGPLTPLRAALQPSKHGRGPLEITGLKVFSKKTSKSEIAIFRLLEGKASARLAALVLSQHGRRLPSLPILPRPPPKFSESRRRSVDDPHTRDP